MGDWAQLHRKEAFPINLKDGDSVSRARRKMVKKVFPFIPARLGLRGRAGRGLKNVCVRRFEVTDGQRDFYKHLIKIKEALPG